MTTQANTATADNSNKADAGQGNNAGQPEVKPEVAAAAPAATKVDPAPATNEQPADGKKPEPEALVLVKPEGSLLSDDSVAKIADFAKSHGLTKEAAQSLLNRENAELTSFQEAQQTAFTERKNNWLKAIETDKEIGGAKYKETIIETHNFIKKFATPDFFQMLEQSGLGNHPELLRTFWRIAKQGKQDTYVGADGAPSVERKPTEKVWYAKTTSKQTE